MRKSYTDTALGQVHARTLAAEQSADQPPLICLHPAPLSGLYFTTVMPMLNHNRKVIAPDYPGYGGSDPISRLGSDPNAQPATIGDYADAMIQFIDVSAAGSSVDILGFHTGCLVGAEIAIRRPDLLRRLVLCDVPYFTADVRPALREKAAQPMPVTEALESIAGPWRFNVSSRLEHVNMPRALALLAEQIRIGADDYRAFDAAFSYDCERQFARLQADTTIIGTQSGLLDATRAAAAVLPDATFIEALQITAAVFETGATAIAKHINATLDA